MDFLQKQESLPVLVFSKELAKAAEIHAEDIALGDEAVHIGGSGSTPTQRIGKQIKWTKMVAECIEIGSMDPSDIVASLIVDDGNEERSNRKVVFSRNVKFVGVACHSHPTFGVVTVIDFIGGIPESQTQGGPTPGQEPGPEYEHQHDHMHEHEHMPGPMPDNMNEHQ